MLAAADELDFAVFRAASALASGRVGRIAVLMSGRVQAWFNGTVLDGLYDGLRAAEQELSVYRVTNLAEREAFFATLPVRRNADALIVASFALTVDELERLSSIGMPLVYVNQRVDDSPSVSIDDAEATRIGIRHLVNLGHRWPAFVRVDNRAGFTYSALARLDGYRAELAAHGANPARRAGAPGRRGRRRGVRRRPAALPARSSDGGDDRVRRARAERAGGVDPDRSAGARGPVRARLRRPDTGGDVRAEHGCSTGHRAGSSGGGVGGPARCGRAAAPAPDRATGVVADPTEHGCPRTMTAVTEDAEPADAKRALRATVRSARGARSALQRANDDRERTRLVRDLVDVSRPSCVAAYLSAGSEPDTLDVVRTLHRLGVDVLLPASRAGAWTDPAWAIYRDDTPLRRGPRDIPEPIGDPLPAEAIARAELVLCPGLAGTPRGERLGRGGGWYDRVLPLATGRQILLLNDDEVLHTVPTEPHDRRVDAIVTPTRSLDCRGERAT